MFAQLQYAYIDIARDILILVKQGARDQYLNG